MLARTDLSGPWYLKAVEDFHPADRQLMVDLSDWLTQEIPAHWQQLPQLASHAGKVVYRKEFTFQKRPGRLYRLRLNGVFYWYDVYLNGQLLGSNEGYFIPAEYDITDLLRENNVLVVEVDCPNEKRKNKKRMITGVFSHWDAIDPATNPGGIWLPVEILESGTIYIKEKYFRTLDFNDQRARVVIKIVLFSQMTQTVTLRLTFVPDNFAGESHQFSWTIRLREGENIFQTRVELENYALWWTHDLGTPNCYRINLEVFQGEELEDRDELKFGLRTIQVKNYIFYLNGQRMLIKGNNYPPGDVRIATMTRERIRQDLRLAKEAHMNMLRVHGHVDHPLLYEVADEEGILLWQDFPLQWQYQRQVLPEAKRQVVAMIKLLYNHPSIAVWCMHNEPIYMVDTKDETFWRTLRTNFNAFVFSWNRDWMDRKLKKAAKRTDHSRFIVRSSGEIALLHRGSDTHWYFGWYGSHGDKRTFELLRRWYFRRNIRFLTEFGAQSFPNYESAVKFMSPDLQKLDWAHLEDHHSCQPEIMRLWLKIDECKSLQELIDLTQDYQIHLHQYYIDRLRFHKYRPTGGMLAFMFQDANPAVSWSVVDYWRVPKRSYYHLKTAFNPEYVFTLLDKDVYQVGEGILFPVYVVNDSQREYPEVKVDFRLESPAGRTIQRMTILTSLEADSLAKKAGEFVLRLGRPGIYRACLVLRYGENQSLENVYQLVVAEGKD